MIGACLATREIAAIPQVVGRLAGNPVPVAIPQRVDRGLIRCTLWHPLALNHGVHAKPALKNDGQRKSHCAITRAPGISPLLNQAVLLKGVNDQARSARSYFFAQSRCGVARLCGAWGRACLNNLLMAGGRGSPIWGP